MTDKHVHKSGTSPVTYGRRNSRGDMPHSRIESSPACTKFYITTSH